MDHFLPVSEVDDETWDRVIAVNVTGVMRLTRAVVPIMQKAGGGAVVTWLASDEASNVNGAIVTSDGGWSAAWLAT